MILHDAQHTGRSPYIGPEKPALKWKRKGIQESWIAVDVRGTVYVESDTSSSKRGIIAINADGSLKWESDLVARECVGLSVAADGNMYLTSKEGFVALDPNGHTRWQRMMKPQDDNLRLVVSSPCVVDTAVYIVVGVDTSRRGALRLRGT